MRARRRRHGRRAREEPRPRHPIENGSGRRGTASWALKESGATAKGNELHRPMPRLATVGIADDEMLHLLVADGRDDPAVGCALAHELGSDARRRGRHEDAVIWSIR